MKKQLPTNAITNELSGASAFFKPQTEPTPLAKPNLAQKFEAGDTTVEQPHSETKEGVRFDTKPRTTAMKQSSYRDVTIPRHHDTAVSRNHEHEMPSKQDTIAPTTIEHIRKAVRQFGKEAATHRFTQEEKRLLADIVYTYERRGYRTSENEITRIAIHWLILDYQAYGEQSVLSRLLEVLHS